VSIKKIKQYLNSSDKIAILLERLKLRNISLEQNDTLVTCGLADSDNPRSVQVRLDSNLSLKIRNRGISGDIIDLVSYVSFESFGDIEQSDLPYLRDRSIRWLNGVLDGDFDDFEVSDNFEYKFESDLDYVGTDNCTYNDGILKEFYPIPHESWLKEKMSPKVLNEFGIMYNYIDDQIVIPCRNKDGELVSIKVRNMRENNGYFGIKYFSTLKPSVGTDLYGLWLTKKFIKKNKQVIIFESEKSVMKAWQYGFKNSVAIATSSLSKRHLSQLLDIIDDTYEVVIALDNDMDMVDIKSIARKFKKVGSDVTYIKHTKGIWRVELEEKDSPVDRGKRLFKILYEARRGLI